MAKKAGQRQRIFGRTNPAIETNGSVSEMRKATDLIGLLICLVMAGCISSQTVTGNSEPTDEAFEHNYQLGAQYYRNGSYELARARLERAIELESKDASAHSLLALTLVQLGNDRLATESFERSVRLDPDDEDVRNAFAVYLCQQGEYDNALEQLDRAEKLIPGLRNWIVHENIGTPLTNARFVNQVAGSLYGREQTVMNQMIPVSTSL